MVKQFLKSMVERFLRLLVKIKRAHTNPTIIGITGSFGKTSTKEAVYAVLSTKWRTYRNAKSLNTEIGLLLAFLEQPSGFSSPLAWARILFGAAINAFFGRNYDFVVMEYGADKPGDIAHLVRILPPHEAIITHIAAVHQAEEQFKDAEAVFEEKKKLAECLPAEGTAILDYADSLLKKLEGKIDARILWFNNASGISAEHLKNTPTGFLATIRMGTQKHAAAFKVAGTYHIDVMLPALLMGTVHGVTLAEGLHALESFHLPPGRMSIIEGKREATLLDSSYNASPETTKEALRLLRDFPLSKKIAVLGNMNELGVQSEHLHREIAHHIGTWLDTLVTVGEMAAIIAEECLKKGFPKARIKTLSTPEEAADFLASHLTKETAVLFKGSQNRVRLERAVKMLMKHPDDAKKLLCRQEPEWERIA